MKITKTQLRKMIKEEIQKSLNERQLSKEESMAEIDKLIAEIGRVEFTNLAKKLVDEAGDDETKLARAYHSLRDTAIQTRKYKASGDPRFY